MGPKILRGIRITGIGEIRNVALQIGRVQPILKTNTEQKALYVHLFGDKHLTDLSCQAVLSQCPKLGVRIQVQSTLNTVSKIQKLLLERKY